MSTPVSHATNAYDLLSEIADLALAEPKRMHMNYWLARPTSVIDYELPKEFPACGTVACIGGWAEVLTESDSAHVVLGLDYDQGFELFYPTALLKAAGEPRRPGEGQTLVHAEKVAAHIRAFQAKHKAQLRAKRIDRRKAP